MIYPKPESMDALKEEIVRARSKFPKNEHLLAALTEEVGELNKAFLEGDFEHAKLEAIQVACVAIRILEEGDSDFTKSKENFDIISKITDFLTSGNTGVLIKSVSVSQTSKQSIDQFIIIHYTACTTEGNYYSHVHQIRKIPQRSDEERFNEFVRNFHLLPKTTSSIETITF